MTQFHLLRPAVAEFNETSRSTMDGKNPGAVVAADIEHVQRSLFA